MFRFICVISMCLFFSLNVLAADAINLYNSDWNQIKRQFSLSQKNFKSARTKNNLRIISEHNDGNKITHRRMQQFYQDLPVFGGYAILHKGATVTLNGTLYKNLEKDLGPMSPSYFASINDVMEKFSASYPANLLTEQNITPIIYVDKFNKAHWAYKVSVLVNNTDKIPERPTAILEANTLNIFAIWNDIKTSFKPALGKGFGGNLRTGKYEYGKNFPLLAISRDEIDRICLMENPDVKVVDMMHRYSSKNLAMSFKCEEDNISSFWTGYEANGYDLENGAFSPVNDALYAGQVVKNMYKEWFNIEVLATQLIMRVHFGLGYPNAFWDGQQMTFGDGDEEIYPLVSIAVGAHEISHGFTEKYSNLEYFGQSGGINESFSDIAAQAAEFYSQGKNSWEIGADIMKSGAIRYMENPEQDGDSIGNAANYTDDLNVHYSSGVYNRFFYILANTNNWDVKKAFSIMVKANMDYWTPTSSFNEAACGIIQAANDLHYEDKDIKKALNIVGINFSEC